MSVCGTELPRLEVVAEVVDLVETVETVEVLKQTSSNCTRLGHVTMQNITRLSPQ